MPQEQINVILTGLEGLAQTEDRAIAMLFTSALSSVKASASRATIPGTRVGGLARYSVAAGASATLRAYLSSSSRTAERDSAMRAVIKAAFTLAEGFDAKRFDDIEVDVDTPDGWSQEEPGLYTRDTDVGTAEIIYNPHMPGGDWSLRLSGVPVGFGMTPAETADTLDEYVSFVTGQVTQPQVRAYATWRRGAR